MVLHISLCPVKSIENKKRIPFRLKYSPLRFLFSTDPGVLENTDGLKKITQDTKFAG